MRGDGVSRRLIGCWAVLIAVALVAAGCGELGIGGVQPAPGSPTRAQVQGLLDRVRVVADRARPGGYQRGCGKGEGCVFGSAWSDDHDGPDGHDGCDTRNDVLAAQLTQVRFRAGTRDCVVVAGVLIDPYTGDRVEFRKEEAGRVQIDHVYPLAAAWDLGASNWPPDKRIRFANDTVTNLLATTTAANQAKSDGTPADWLPPRAENHCFYAGKYLTVAVAYDLPVTAADNAVLHDIARDCP